MNEFSSGLKSFLLFSFSSSPFCLVSSGQIALEARQSWNLNPSVKTFSRSETRSHIFYSIVHRQMVLTSSHENGIDSGIY